MQFKIEMHRLQAEYTQGRLADAEQRARRICLRWPRNGEAANALGGILGRLGRNEEALPHLRRAAALDPSNAMSHNNLGNVLFRLEQFDLAEAEFARAISLDPKFKEPLLNLARICLATGRPDAAEQSLQRALRLDPLNAEAWSLLGFVLGPLGRVSQAEAAHRRALELRPGMAKSLAGLGVTLAIQGRLEEAHRSILACVHAEPENTAGLSALLMLGTYGAGSAAESRAHALRFGAVASMRASAPYSTWCAPAPGKLRIGLVSGDLREHPVGYFLEAAIAAIDPARFELYAYAANPVGDVVTARLKRHFVQWRPIHALDDGTAAAAIHADAIHILIDLSGHSEHNRLPLFAWRPAPLQISWLGYWSTTGLREIDYVLADPIQVPEGAEDEFVERVWRLPRTRFCFTAPSDPIEVSALPAAAGTGVTFGCFNSLQKLNAGVIDLWARILCEVPDSRLILKARFLDESGPRTRLLREFLARKVDGARIALEGASPRSEYLRAYHRVDMALDPFPFSGGTTSAEALWMGVPVLSLSGDSMVARQGAGVLAAAGLPDWIARDADDYLELARERASRLAELEVLRRELRPRVLQSALFDAPGFARDFEAALEAMWSLTGAARTGSV